MDHPFITRYLEIESDDGPALLWTGGDLSHQAFKHKIRQRINWLLESGLSAGDRLALQLPKGPLSVECLLAGMALGCVVIPIDPKAPSGRTQSILNEMTPTLSLTTENTPGNLKSGLWQGQLPQNNAAPALILMTSGSTGTPKGIVLSHENISTFVNWSIRTFELGNNDRFVSIAPLHFDLSMLDVYAGLLAGGSIFLPTEQEISFPGSMANIFENHKPTILYAVPSMLQIFQRFRLFDKLDFTGLRWLLFAGEVFPLEALRKLRASLPEPRLANLFGPTETNVFCWHEVNALPNDLKQLPIGQTCDHSEIKIFNDRGEELPTGEAGEIGVSGPSVMIGYFMDGKVQPPMKYGQYYRTGDYGYVDERSCLRFAGRQDDMAKVRGIRFSLKEVEALTLSVGSCEQAVAILLDKDTLDARIVLHVVAKENSVFKEDGLKSYLANHLPHQACPATIQQHLEFPYTSNGKIDRLALSKHGL